MDKTNDLVDFMHSQTREIEEEYARILKRSTEDPGTAGDQGEENWAELLRNWLPADYQIVTKGRLINIDGETSPQVDIIVLKPFYPKHLLNKKLYLTAGVIAAFECKNTLKSDHIKKTLHNSIKIRRLLKLEESTYIKELHSPIIYGLLAHSHSWKKDTSTPRRNIDKKLKEEDVYNITHPRECLDILCVADLALWSSFKAPMAYEYYQEDEKWKIKWIEMVQTGYSMSKEYEYTKTYEENSPFTPVGAMLGRLYNKLALTDKRLKDFSNYLNKTIVGDYSIFLRNWTFNTLSEKARVDLRKNFDYYSKKFNDEG